MTEDEFLVLARGIKAAYPANKIFQDDASIKVWYRFLKDLDYSVVELAIYQHICSNKFPPTIAEILEQCVSVMDTDPKTWLDGWATTTKCMGRYGYYREAEALEAIKAEDPTAYEVVRKLGWKRMCMSEDVTADRANFRQCYEAMRGRAREEAKLPVNVQKKMSALTKKFALKGAEA